MNNGPKSSELSDALQEQCQTEDWAGVSSTLKSLSLCFHNEKNFNDEMRCHILSFYLDMSGCYRQPFVNEKTVGCMRDLRDLLELDKTNLSDMYYESIKALSLPSHSFVPTGCLRVLTYCVFGKSRKADKIMSYLQK